jgi:uncharacterized protein
MNVKDLEFKALLEKYKKITVIGLSPDKGKPSHTVPLYMKNKGYDVVGIYPGESEIAGMKIYPSLRDVPAEYRKFVDVFRRSEKLPQVVDEVLEVGGVEVLWIQLGLAHPAAEKRAEDAGIKVVSDRCLYIERKKYM